MILHAHVFRKRFKRSGRIGPWPVVLWTGIGLWLIFGLAACATRCGNGNEAPPHATPHGQNQKAPRQPRNDSRRKLDPTPDPGYVRCAILGARKSPNQRRTVGGKPYRHRGYRLIAEWKQRKNRFAVGVITAVHQPRKDTLAQLNTLKTRCRKHDCRAIVALGDLGRTTKEITRTLAALASPQHPVLALPGARDHIRHFQRALAQLRKKKRAVVDLSAIRIVRWPEITLISMPGHPRHQPLGAGWWSCGFTKGDVAELSTVLRDEPGPFLLAAHATVRMYGRDGLDVGFGGAHLGSAPLARLWTQHSVMAAVMGHIHEAGPGASTGLHWRPARSDSWHPRLLLNPGAADAVEHASRDGACPHGSAQILEFRTRNRTEHQNRTRPPASSTLKVRYKTVCLGM
jgi:hypothetical protein